MAKVSKITGDDAAYMAPRLIPDYELLPRDDSGGPEFQDYNAQFGDGGYVTGQKKHLSVMGGKDDSLNDDEQADDLRAVPAEKALGQTNVDSPKSPRKSIKMAKK